MKQVKVFLLIVIISLLSGCTGTSEKWKGIKFGKINSQTASKTHNYPLKWVDEATLRTLDQMEIMIIEDSSSPTGRSIKAATLNLDIFIELKSVTPSSTQMKIDVKLADDEDHSLTADEIIEQTHQYLLANAEIETTDLVKQVDFKEENTPAK